MNKHSGVDDGRRGWEGRSKGAERVPLRPTQSPAVLPQQSFHMRRLLWRSCTGNHDTGLTHMLKTIVDQIKGVFSWVRKRLGQTFLRNMMQHLNRWQHSLRPCKCSLQHCRQSLVAVDAVRNGINSLVLHIIRKIYRQNKYQLTIWSLTSGFFSEISLTLRRNFPAWIVKQVHGRSTFLLMVVIKTHFLCMSFLQANKLYPPSRDFLCLYIIWVWISSGSTCYRLRLVHRCSRMLPVQRLWGEVVCLCPFPPLFLGEFH